MWWSRRAILTLPLALCACGFSPVYGPGGTGDTLRNRLAFQEPRSREQFTLVQRLEQRFGRAANPDYRVEYRFSLNQELLAVSITGAQTRYNLVGVLNYTLEDTRSGQVILSDRIEDFASYSAAGTTIATFAASEDARERLMISIADGVASRLLAANLP